MKNLICNCCFSGFLYKKTNTQYDSPFFWNRITAKDFIKLIINFDKIDFSNISVITNQDLVKIDPISCLPTNPSIILKDCNIRVIFNHYKFSEADQTPRIAYPDVYYNKNCTYCVDKFLERSKRMTKESKTFIYVDNARQYDSVDDIYLLMNAANETKNTLYIFTEDKNIAFNSAYVNIIHTAICFDDMVEKYYKIFR